MKTYMDSIEIRNNPNYPISYNPLFLILKHNEEYMFYNSVNHKAFRLRNFEFELINLLYTYEDVAYVSSLFEDNMRDDILRLADIINNLEIIKLVDCPCPELSDFNRNENPSTFYLHLTHKCNLKCSYCYNREWRNGDSKMLSFFEWEVIIAKILRFSKKIVLTGGEFFLVPFVPNLLKYIKEHKPDVIIEGLSNGCLDYKESHIIESLKYIDKITLSCDSLNYNDDRIGFNKDQFLSNINLLKSKFPNIIVSIATTITTKNYLSINDIKLLCNSNGLEWKKTAVCPSSPQDTYMMVDLKQQVDETIALRSLSEKSNEWFPKQKRCGAAKSVCSIDASGNVYPCQALHYDDFYMGNLLSTDLNNLRYIVDSSNVIPSVDEIIPCNTCKVKYICGGGCFANRFTFNKTGDYSSIFCPMRYEKSLSMLLSLDNRVIKE